MSSKHDLPTIKHAVAYNAKRASAIIQGPLPDLLLENYCGLGDACNDASFAQAVMAFQRAEMPGTLADGKLGPMTWRTMLSRYDTIDSFANYVVWAGRRISIGDEDSPYRMINFDEAGGCSLHEVGHFSAWGMGSVDRVIMHWGGLDPAHLHAVMSVPDRKVSTHFGIGIHEGEPVVMQYIDIAHKTWHAGKFNSNAVGVDICQQPVYKWSSHYGKRGYDVKKIKNPTDRGNVNILSLEPRIAAATDAFVSDLLSVLELKAIAPDHHGVVNDAGQYTLLGHHHVSPQKWDIACWWGDALRATCGE
jgi:hypothetical protein